MYISNSQHPTRRMCPVMHQKRGKQQRCSVTRKLIFKKRTWRDRGVSGLDLMREPSMFLFITHFLWVNIRFLCGYSEGGKIKPLRFVLVWPSQGIDKKYKRCVENVHVLIYCFELRIYIHTYIFIYIYTCAMPLHFIKRLELNLDKLKQHFTKVLISSAPSYITPECFLPPKVPGSFVSVAIFMLMVQLCDLWRKN